MTLLIHEIFHSLQGETTFVGRPTVFVRLTACNLRCRWCDTEHAFYEGKKRELDDVLAEVRGHGARYVCVTGGEPLLQKNVYPLMEALVSEGYTVSLETGGSLPAHDVPQAVHRILDVKCPGSGEVEKNHWANLDALRPNDQLKFVIADRADFEWATRVVRERRLAETNTVLFSPVQGELVPKDLAAWILAEKLPVAFQLQLHKVLWGAETHGV